MANGAFDNYVHPGSDIKRRFVSFHMEIDSIRDPFVDAQIVLSYEEDDDAEIQKRRLNIESWNGLSVVIWDASLETNFDDVDFPLEGECDDCLFLRYLIMWIDIPRRVYNESSFLESINYPMKREIFRLLRLPIEIRRKIYEDAMVRRFILS